MARQTREHRHKQKDSENINFSDSSVWLWDVNNRPANIVKWKIGRKNFIQTKNPRTATARTMLVIGLSSDPVLHLRLLHWSFSIFFVIFQNCRKNQYPYYPFSVSMLTCLSRHNFYNPFIVAFPIATLRFISLWHRPANIVKWKIGRIFFTQAKNSKK